MVLCVIALLLMAIAVGVLAWQLWVARQALMQSRAACEDMRQDHAIRENLQRILDRREEQVRRLRKKLKQAQDRAAELEGKLSEMNLSLFHESGLRILAEKEVGARGMKLELSERQLMETQRKLKEERAEAAEVQKQLRQVISELQTQIDLSAARPSRRARRAANLANQVSFEELSAREKQT